MIRQRTFVSATIAFVALLGVLAAARQRTTDPADAVAHEIRDLRLTIERTSAISVQVTLIAMQASAAQARIAGITVELANLRAQGTLVAAQTARQRQIVADFERDNPEAASDPAVALRSPQYQEYQRAKATLGSSSQPEDYFRARETELAAIQFREQAQLNDLLAKLEVLERSLKAGQ
jgi:hypothetical protein